MQIHVVTYSAILGSLIGDQADHNKSNDGDACKHAETDRKNGELLPRERECGLSHGWGRGLIRRTGGSSGRAGHISGCGCSASRNALQGRIRPSMTNTANNISHSKTQRQKTSQKSQRTRLYS
jgi:hypothetical protein